MLWWVRYRLRKEGLQEEMEGDLDEGTRERGGGGVLAVRWV